MTQQQITKTEELLKKLAELRAAKTAQEDEIKEVYEEIKSSLNPVTFIKNSLRTLREDQQVRSDLSSVSLNMGFRLAVSRILGKNRSIQVYMAAIVIERFALPLIKENWPMIQALSNRIFKSKEEEEVNHNGTQAAEYISEGNRSHVTRLEQGLPVDSAKDNGMNR